MTFLDTLNKRCFRANKEKFEFYKKLGCSDTISLFLSFYTYSSYLYSFSLKDFEAVARLETKIENIYEFFGNQIKEILESVTNDEIDTQNILINHPMYKSLRAVSEIDFDSSNDLYLSSNISKGVCGQSVLRCSSPIKKVKTSNISKERVLNSCVSYDTLKSEEFDESLETEHYLESSYMDNSDEISELLNNTSIDGVNNLFIGLNTDSYNQIIEKGFKGVLESPYSSFKMTTNNASLGILLNNLYNNRLIDKSMVRIEDIMNSVNLGLKKPKNRKFNYITRLCDKPNSKNKLFFVGVQSEDIDVKEVYQNVTILLDVSGSMSYLNEITQESVISLFMGLKDNDIVSMVTYSTTDSIIFENKTVGKDITISDFIDYLFSITINGCTYGSKGIETAYELTKRTYKENNINRVVLITDGDLNFGINSNDGLQRLIEEKRDTGIFLTVIGTGLYNYKDDKLEILSKYGNGNYCVVNTLLDVEYNLITCYNSMMFTIAKDVKAEVEFNPYFVKSYRLLGYENREISHSEFKDDSVVSDPFGSGSWGIALYELEMNDSLSNVDSELKYLKTSIKDTKHLCTVCVRYKEIDSEVSKEQNLEIDYCVKEIDTIVNYIYSVFVLCEKFRGSKYINDSDLDKVKLIMQEKDVILLDNKNYNLISKLCVNLSRC